ncbi:MAG: zf-HC2 domain-containing protein [Gemmatimonadetes bacterium]|nr:zf-HC2 domain-containing protein [Gemmatimonadota bacterium]
MRNDRDQHLSDELLERYADADLAGAARASADRHLAACPACRARLSEWQSLFLQLSALPQLPPAQGFAERVLSRLVVGAAGAAAAPGKAARRAVRVPGWARRLVPAAAGAGALWTGGVAAALFWLYRRAGATPGGILTWAAGELRDAFWGGIVRVAEVITLSGVGTYAVPLLLLWAIFGAFATWGAWTLYRLAGPTARVRSYA